MMVVAGTKQLVPPVSSARIWRDTSIQDSDDFDPLNAAARLRDYLLEQGGKLPGNRQDMSGKWPCERGSVVTGVWPQVST